MAWHAHTTSLLTHTRFQDVDILIYRHVQWRTSDISHTSLQQLTEITKKSFCQSVQKRWREGKRKEEKNQNDNYKALCVTRKFKNAKIVSIFTAQNGELLTNVPCFSKKLKRIVSNRLFLYLNEKGHLLKNQFGFQHCMSIGHPILSWDAHIDVMENKVSKYKGILSNAKHVLSIVSY